MSRAVAFALFLLLLALGIQAAFGCSCITPTVKEARDQADAVFLGTVKSVEFLDPLNRGSRVIVTFEVTRVWKGPVTKKFEMRNIVETTFCEGFFKSDLVVEKQLLVLLIAFWTL